MLIVFNYVGTLSQRVPLFSPSSSIFLTHPLHFVSPLLLLLPLLFTLLLLLLPLLLSHLLLKYLVEILYRPSTSNAGHKLCKSCRDISAGHHQTSVTFVFGKSFKVPKESSGVRALRKSNFVMDQPILTFYLFCTFVARTTGGAELFVGLKNFSTFLAGETAGHAGFFESHHLGELGQLSNSGILQLTIVSPGSMDSGSWRLKRQYLRLSHGCVYIHVDTGTLQDTRPPCSPPPQPPSPASPC